MLNAKWFDTFKSSRTIVWFSRIMSVESLCKKSLLKSLILACSLATFSLDCSDLFEPCFFLDRLRCSFLNLLRFFFNGFGASIFSPVSNVAKVLIPKSMPILLLVAGADCFSISTTKLRKYLLALSLMMVTDDGSEGNSLYHIGFTMPILAK